MANLRATKDSAIRLTKDTNILNLSQFNILLNNIHITRYPREPRGVFFLKLIIAGTTSITTISQDNHENHVVFFSKADHSWNYLPHGITLTFLWHHFDFDLTLPLPYLAWYPFLNLVLVLTLSLSCPALSCHNLVSTLPRPCLDNLPLKFGQNCDMNSRDIPGIYKCHNMFLMFPGTYL